MQQEGRAGLRKPARHFLSHLHSAALGKDGVPWLPGASRAFLRCAGAVPPWNPDPTSDANLLGRRARGAAPVPSAPREARAARSSPGPRAPNVGANPASASRSRTEKPNSGPGGTRDSRPTAPPPPGPVPRLHRGGAALGAGAGSGAHCGRGSRSRRQRPGERRPRRLAGSRRAAWSVRKGLLEAAPGRGGEGCTAGEGTGAREGAGRWEGWAALPCFQAAGESPAARPPPPEPLERRGRPVGRGRGCQTRVHNGMNEGLPLTLAPSGRDSSP